MLGSMGIRTILSLVLGLMVLSTIVSFSTVGSVGAAIQQGFDQINGQTSFTTEVDNPETFSDLAMFVRDRAVSCEEVSSRNDGEILESDPRDSLSGYPGLSGTRLGQNPECIGGDATVLRSKGPLDAGTPDIIEDKPDNFMPGIYSREKFEITEDIAFEDNRRPVSDDEDSYDKNDYWLENRIAAVSGKPFETQVQDTNQYSESGSNYVIFFEDSEVAEKRTNQLLSEWEDENGDKIYSDRVWAREDGQEGLWSSGGNDALEYIRYHPTGLTLCEGDKGYIQMNLGNPLNDGLPESEQYQFPRIVITDTEQESCGDVNLGREDMIPEDAVTKGQVLSITTRTGLRRDYPYFYCTTMGPGCPSEHVFNLHDVKEEGYERDPTWGGSLEINPNRDTCHIGLLDTNSASSDAVGNVAVAQGYLLEKDTEGFPGEDNPFVVNMDLESRILTDAEDMYSSYVQTGLDKRETSVTTPILYSYTGEPRLELYGDLVCAEDDGWSSWTMCDDDGKTVQGGGKEWTCNGETGDWSTDDSEGTASEVITVTNDWDEATPESQEWLDTSSDSFTINSSEASEDIGMTWEEELPGTWQNFSVTVTPDKRGHLRIGGQGAENYQDYPYFYFGAEGASGENDMIYFNPPDRTEYFTEPANYEPGETYTFSFDRINNEVTLEENGETVWTYETESLDFPRIRLYQINQFEDTEATIESIDVTYLQTE